MLSKVLVASDGSEASLRVVECLKGLRRVGSREALLVHVFNVRRLGGAYTTVEAALRQKLEAQKRVLETDGFKVSIETAVGIPFQEINRLASERGCSLIVIGSLGESAIGEMLLGSTAYALLHNAVLSVLLMRIEICGEEGAADRCRLVCRDCFQHILFPTDFSDNAERAFTYLQHVVREAKSEVTLLHVQDRAKIEDHLAHRLEEFTRIDTKRLDRMKEALVQSGAPSVQTEILYGSPTALILDAARSPCVSLVVMGSQGRGLITELFLGSVAHNVARLAPVPVLLIPPLR